MTVGLPREWARHLSLSKGSLVMIDVASDSLVIRPLKKNEESSVKKFAVAYPQERIQYVINQVTGAYLLGYDIIEVGARTRLAPEDRERLVKAVKSLLGLEVVEEDANKVTMQVLVDPSSLNPEQALRRMHAMTKGMQYDAAMALAKKDVVLGRLVVERDEELDRLYFLVVRFLRAAAVNPSIANRFGLNPIDLLDYRVAAHLLENIGDASLEAALIAESPDFKIDSKIKKMLVSVTDVLQKNQELAVRAFLSRDIRYASEVVAGYEEARAMLLPLAEAASQSGPALGRTLANVHSAFMRISRLHVDIADLAVPLYSLVK